MKKRFFSSLLMGALVTATLSTVTSCKDYDDDISNLQGQIDKLATVDQLEQKVNELKGLISTNSSSITSLQTSIEKAQKAAEAAQSAADKKATLEEVKKLLEDSDYATKKYVDDADAILDAAIKAVQTKDIAELTAAVQKAQKAAEDAQATADTAKQEAEAAGSKDSEAYKKAEAAATEAAQAKSALEALQKSLGTGYSETQTVAQAIEAINNLLKADKTGLSGLNSRLNTVEQALKGAEEGSTLNISTKLAEIEASLKNIIGQYSTMVTAVELYGVSEGNAYYNFDRKLNFIQTEEQTNVFPKDGAADDKFTFEKGKYYVGEDSLLVRVSPVDAELTKENISLLNSQGQEISDDVIEVTSVSRNKELFTSYTRAAGVNTGLWVVKFKAKDVTEKFEEAAIHKDEYGIKRSILYAVAVKNTYNTTGKAEDAKDRRVTSEYGVSLYTDVAQHGYDFDVNGTYIYKIKNRYTYDEDNKDSWNNNYYADIPELDWINNEEPATEAITEGADKNAKNRTGIDDRDPHSVLAVEKGKEITIDFSKYKDIKGFYVTLDTKFALQSAPSELNAWNSYTYTNVGYKKNGTTNVPAKLFKGNKGSIVINDLGNVTGDVIGFRVYAVNYDGTLTDPDGRAFYVAVGDVAVDVTIPTANAKCTIENGANLFATDYIAVNGAFDKDYDKTEGWINDDKDASGSKPVFDVKYYDKDKNEVSSLSGSDIAFVKFFMTNPTSFIDGATYTQTMTLKKRISNTLAVVGTITVSAKKVMPTDAPEFAYRDGFDKLNGKAGHQYIQPWNGYTCAPYNKGGYFDFKNMLIVNNNKDWNGGDAFYSSNGAFKFIVANGTFGSNDKKEEATAERSAFWLNVNNGNNENLVDNSTTRQITGEYQYFNISKKLDATTNTYVYKPYPVKSGTTDVNIVYCSWTDGFGVKTAAADTWAKEVNKVAPNQVTWTTAGNGTTTLDLSKLDVNIPAKDYISWATPAFKDLNSLKALLDAKYLTIVADDNYGKVYTSSSEKKFNEKKEYDGQINPYFTASIVNNNIVLTQRNQSVLPSAVNKEYIHLTVKDCFGNKIALALPFVIKK